MVRSSKPQLALIMPNGLKEALEKASKRLGCSQAEVVRTALYEFFKDLGILLEQVTKSKIKGDVGIRIENASGKDD